MTAAPEPSWAEPTLARLRRADAARCAEIELELFPADSPWSARAFRAELDSGAYYLGAYDTEGALIGYAGLAIVGRPGEYEAEVHTIGVTAEAQGRGVGRALLDGLLARADAFDAVVFLEVRTDNVAAIALYTGAGFRTVGLRERYYQPSGADAYTMRRPAASESGGAASRGSEGSS
ncbi:ribosomal protein S18-alanine N-acetyltransferase [Haloechinothrix sp. YIM 98757]|uniref:Ribosomal protein S18-alanine N-acetyltransferase n=1 Tax=Haloechinothrix aidingensis TaxID=2752311 RepID=A0A838A0Y1_9PSEU|nr:ribosomal protein S18-alanine N-acetyltransferase [Haloechinothrix aidingensis]MBA0124783.1 ribosomal protein S18-alanine N-acetyltransferase [Haloechinothrix aidingensis]